MSCLSSGLKSLLAIFVIIGLSSGPVLAQSSIEIFQDKLIAVEEGLKDIRSIVEEDFRALKLSLEDNEGISSDEMRDLDNKIGILADQINALTTRIDRTLQVAADNEFRLIRLEKRIESMVRLSIDGSLTATGPANQGAGEAPQSSIASSENSETNWSIDQETLSEEISKLPNPEDALVEDALVEDALVEDEAVATQEAETTVAVQEDTIEDTLSVLPEVSADEQYSFALGKALQNDLDMAELAFDEFLQQHPDHDSANDAMFWLGRVQFMKNAYEKAALTFTAFNSEYPTDDRREKTTLLIAESISYFAPTNEACDLLVSLPNLIEDPTDSFFQRLDKLKVKAKCSG